MAPENPERITAIITQNGNAYEEGLSESWNPIRTYWQNPSSTNRDALRGFFSPETYLLAVRAWLHRSDAYFPGRLFA